MPAVLEVPNGRTHLRLRVILNAPSAFTISIGEITEHGARATESEIHVDLNSVGELVAALETLKARYDAAAR